MKVSEISILIALFVCQTNGLYIRYDLTNPLNAVRAGNLSIEQFVASIEPKGGAKLNVIHGLYVTDCKILECGDQIRDVIQSVQESQAVNRSIILHLKFGIDIETLQNFKMPTNVIRLHLPEGKYWIHFALPDNVTCTDLKDVTAANWELQMTPLTWFSSDTVKNILGVGFGYNKDLIGCYVLYKVIPLCSYFITSMDFGKTPGVVESFGLFKKRMDSLHDYNIEFMKVMFRSNYTEPYIDYYVPPQSVGDAVHRRLLHSFWKLVVTPHDSKIGVVLPMPLTKLPRLYPGKVIPYIDSESCSHVNDIPWYATSALATLSKHFQSAVLTHAEWTLLKSVAAQKYYAATNKTNIHRDIRLDIIIDYTDWLPYNPVVFGSTRCDHKWEAIEAELMVFNRQREYPLENVMAKALLFAVENKNDGGFSVNVDREFAKRMSSRVTIGCGFQAASFGDLNDTTAQAVVDACKQVHGSLYTLQSYLKLDSIATLNIVNSQQFENNVRPKLEGMKSFRNIILAKHPEADVFFQLRFDLNILDYTATVFCNREALSLHEQIEGISNWALFNAIPLIIGRAFDDVNHGVFQTWFSVLRPTLENFRDVNPYLIVLNYPKIRDTMDLEPCIESTKERPALLLTYFHNNYIGSSFDATNMRKDRPITKDEYEILLQFILHRFDLVEVLLAKDSYKNFVRALDKLATDGLIDHAKKFLILFDHGEFSEQEQLETFYSFLNFTKVTLGNNIEFIQGITYGLGAFLDQTENMSYEEFMNATYHRHTMIVGWGQTFNLTMGVFMGIDNCEQLLLQSKKSNDFITEPFLRSAEYIVCHENMDLNTYNKTKTLGEFLDRNLYIKKFTDEFYPQLNLHFKVSVNVTLTEVTLSEYLILISHMKSFAVISNISYILVDAFGEESFPTNGWWKITNYSDLALPLVYEEKYSAFLGSPSWRPLSNFQPKLISANDKQDVALVVIFSVLILLILVMGFGLWYYKNKEMHYLSNEEEYEFRNGLKVSGEENSFELESFKFDANQYPYNKQLEIAKEEFRFDQSKYIGSGTFGRVYKMRVANFESEVAVKIPQLSVGKDAILGALQEIKILTFIGTHENVIRILGAYTKEIKLGRVYIVTEFCSKGSLLIYLQTSKNDLDPTQTSSSSVGIEKSLETVQEREPITLYEMLRYSTEIANGMEFISKKKVVHADLAARNILLDHNRVVKICDFGLSKKLYNYKDYVKKDKDPMPWRWMAIETLKKMEFSTMSDVWSYGITVWEIFTLGNVPYPTMTWDDDFILKLEQGLRPIKPVRSSYEVYKLMECCWNITPNLRPTFAELREMVSNLKIYAYQQVV